MYSSTTPATSEASSAKWRLLASTTSTGSDSAITTGSAPRSVTTFSTSVSHW